MAEDRIQASGWRTFAAVVVTIVGLLNVFQGIAAMLADNVAYVDANNLLIVDTTGWGIVALIFGAVLLFAGYGLSTGSGVARAFVVIAATLHALVQMFTLAAYPVWSIVMITMDVLIIYGLTVHWHDAPTTPATGRHDYDYLERTPSRDANRSRDMAGVR